MGKFNSPQGVVPALPLPPSPDGFSTGVTAHLCTSSVCTSAARFYFKNRPSMTRNSEKHLKVQEKFAGKIPHCSKETLTGVRAFCMIHGQHGTWNVSVVPFPQRAVLGLQGNVPKHSQCFCTALWIDAAKCIWRKRISKLCWTPVSNTRGQKLDIFPCLVA